jgi:hypothetical protein
MILGTIKRIFRNGREEGEEGEDRECVDIKANLFAHSRAISVLPVPVLYSIVPLKSLSIHAFTASI